MNDLGKSARSNAQLDQLLTTAADVIQSTLTSEQIPLKERTDLALKVLALESGALQPEALQQTALPSNADPIIPQNTESATISTAQLEPSVQAGSVQGESVQTISKQTTSAPTPVESDPLAQLPPGWREWVITNKQRRCSEQTLIETMVSQGIDLKIATQAVRVADQQLQVQDQALKVQQCQKLESILNIQAQLQALSSAFGQIERRDRISQSEFLDRYYATNTPLILTDMLQAWPALSLWTPEYLATHYGDVEVEVQSGRESDPDYEMNIAKHKQKTSLSTYADKVVNGGITNDYYMVANNGNLDRPEFAGLLKDIQPFPEFFDPTQTKSRVFFWFGPAGTITPLHHDSMNIMMAHLYGRKRWRLISPSYTPLIYNHIGVFSQVDLENPDYDKYPLFKDVPVIEVILEPGELLFIPVGWWHQVKGLDVTIAVSMTNFVFPNQFEFRNPDIRSIDTVATANALAGQKPALQQTEASWQMPSQPRRFQLGEQTLTNDVVDTTEDCYLVDKIIPGAPLVITFGFVNWQGSPRFDFYGRTKKLENLANQPLNRILVRDPLNAWYHRGIPGLGRTVDDITLQLKTLIQKISPSQVITLGQSMGAYAAIMFGQLLGVDQILAFGPLSFLNSAQAEAIGDHRWLSVMQRLEAVPPDIFYNDLVLLSQAYGVADMRVYYGLKPDPEVASDINLDDYHAKRLGELPGCQLYPYRESSHAVVKYLNDTKQMDDLLLEAIFKLTPTLATVSNV